MSDIIGGENHFPLGFGSADRTFDLDFSAGDSNFGLDFGAAIIGGGSSLPDGGEAGQVLTKVSDDDGDAEWRSPAPTFPPLRFDFWVAKDQDGDLYIVNGPSPSTVIEESRSGAARVQQAVLYFDENGNHKIFLQLAEARWQKEGMLLPEIMFVGSNKTNGDIITLSAFSGARQWTLKTTNPAAYALDEALEAVSTAEETFSETVGPLGELETETTDNLVAAINEVNEKASSGADLSAYRTAAAQDVIDAAKYEKPSTGIPKTDLASDVQTSLGKADTALQSHQSLAAYRTAADQDTIDAAQDTAIAGKLPTTGNAYRTASIPMGQLDSTSTATVMTATVPGITELRDGVCMWLKNGVVSSASGVTLNINGLGAKPLYSSLAAATRSTTIFSSAYTLLFIYNSTRVDGGCWDVVYGIDTNTNTVGYQLRTNSTTMPMASVVYRYRLLFTSADGTHLVPANNSTSTNATSSRTVCQTPIDPFGTIYYYGTTSSVAANANPSAANLWTRYVITLGYSFNRTGTALALTPNVPVYIKAAPQTDGSAIIDASNPYVQTLPTTEDGKIYIFLGIAASATTVELQDNHPVYCYRKGSIRKWTGVEAELDALYEMIENLEPGGDDDDVPSYVKTEALSVANRVQSHLQSDSIVFIAGSDSHQSDTDHVADGNLHGGQAMKSLASILPLDFSAYLGDYTAGSSTTTLAEGRAHFAEINADIDPAFRKLVQFRTTGNHDPLGYSYAANGNQSLGLAEMYQYIGKYNDDGTTVMGSTTSGYCYRDFPAKSLRVICLNTAEADGNGNQPPQGSAEFMTTAQKCWFADTLISTPQGYGIIILCHHPLDWGKIIIQASHILRAYVEELPPSQQNPINFGSGVTYDFTGKNKSAWVLQVHGHVHSYTVDNLHYVTNIVSSTTATAYGVKRIAVPNMCFVRNNEYGRNTGPEYYDIEFGTSQTYNKTANSGEDTAFSVFVVNPSEEKAYVINYGAGYDREVYWGAIVVPVTGVTLNANSGTLYAGGSLTLTATVAPQDASNKAVIWSSSNDTVATVNGGVVTAHALGSATITVTTQDGGFTASYALTVQAVPRGNLMPSVGWFDDTRRKSDGTTAEDTGIVSTGYIDIHTNVSYPATVRIKGAEFRTARAWQANVIAYPSTQLNGTAESIVDGGSGPRPLNGSTMTVSSDGQEVVLTIPTKNNSYPYLVFNGKGSGANLDLRINENFD